MYKEKTCPICNQLFVPKSARQSSCNRIIKKTCPICGEEFESKCTVQNTSATCGKKECRSKYAYMKSEEAQSKAVRICAWCGKEFHPKNNTQIYCTDIHYATCKVCGKSFEVNLKVAKSDIRKTCSKECAVQIQGADYSNPEVVAKIQAKMQATCMERYGVAHPAQNAEVQAKMRATTKERYGVEYFIHSPEYKDKTIATNLAKYGVEWQMQAPEVRAKIVASNMEHYGAPSHMQNPEFLKQYQDNLEAKTGYRSSLANPEVREKGKQTTQEKYGVDFYSQTDEFKERFKQTSLERFGTENPNQNESVKEKTKQTSLEKYGATNYLSSEEGKHHAKERVKELYGADHIAQSTYWKSKKLKYCTNLAEWMLFAADPEAYITSHFNEAPTYKQIAEATGVLYSTVTDCMIRKGLTHLVATSMSYMEDELVSFLQSFDITVVQHERQLIKPLELDIYLPEYRIAIECNPTATHNSSLGDPWEDKKKPADYHKKKSDMCEVADITLFHVFGYDWTYNRDKVLSMLVNLIGKNEETIYARKCIVKEVPGQDSINFLNANHRQGSANSPIRLGLYYTDELVSLMTFGKMRGTIGTGKEDLSECWELVRFCSKLNTSVVGGASKLFKHFIKLYQPRQIRSFSDRAHTRGNLYKQLGFVEIRRSEANYVWVDIKTDKAYHRVNAQKKNLKKFLHDDNIDLSKSEKQIMEEHGFVQVYDSGTITWEWCA